MIEKYTINPTYKKEGGLWLLNTDSPGLPVDFKIIERNVVYIPAGECGGNHKHPRNEVFLGIGDNLELIWQDEEGEKHLEPMSSKDDAQLKLLIVFSMTPHVVINRGSNAAVLIEFADNVQYGVEPVNLL